MAEESLVLRETETAKTLSVSKAALRRWRREQKGPPYVRLGRAIGYLRSDLERFLAQSRKNTK